MAENKILPWAQTPTANDLSDADYAADVATGGLYADGVKSGQASSKQANKTWRQATAPGSGLAQFIVDNLALDVTDSDTPVMFSSRIANAVLKLAQISPFNQYWASATGGYRKYAIVSDSSGNFWVSTADQNTTVPGSNGANWQSLFDGYITESTADNRYVRFIDDNVNQPVQYIGVNKENSTPWFKSGPDYYNLQPAGDYATNPDLNTEITNRTNADTNLQSQINNRVHQGGGVGQGNNTIYIGWASDASGLKATVDISDLGTFAFEGWCNNTFLKLTGGNVTGGIGATNYITAGINGGWNGARTNTGDYGWTNGLAFGNPDNDGKYRGTWTVTDVLNEGGSNSSGLNLTGYDSAGTAYQWYFAWNGKVTTPGGVLAFESDLSGYVANTNTGIQGALAGTSLCVNPSDGRSYLAYSGNTKIASLAWYSDVVGEATARTNADNNLQAQISSKMDGSFAASGLFDGSQGSTTSGTIIGGTWMRVGNTLTQNLVIENIGGGTVTFPFAFSGNNNQVTVIVQDGTGSNNSYTTGSITTTGTGIHASGGGGTGRLHLTVSGPYGT